LKLTVDRLRSRAASDPAGPGPYANGRKTHRLVTAPEPDCWLHPNVEVRASQIEGKGLFALSGIPAGTLVSRVGGRLVSGAELRDAFDAAVHDPARPYIDCITVDDDLHLILPPRRPNGYGNHGCDPNLWWTGSYTQVARRDIAPGEELTTDYAASTGVAEFRMNCACGSPLCRNVVTGIDWQRADLQHRYGEHWIPALLKLIRASRMPVAPPP
jgi:uncharacterized protein